MNVAGCFSSRRWVASRVRRGLGVSAGRRRRTNRTGTIRTGDLHQRRRADPEALVRPVPSPDEMAPMSLMTYADARPWARAIKSA